MLRKMLILELTDLPDVESRAKKHKLLKSQVSQVQERGNNSIFAFHLLQINFGHKTHLVVDIGHANVSTWQ